MTEAEWLACTDPQAMLDFLRTREGVTDRKLRLFACACCRDIWFLLTDERSRNAVVVRERYEDGLATSREVKAAADAARRARAGIRRPFRFASGLKEDSPELGPGYAAGAASNTASGNWHPVVWFVTTAAACVSHAAADMERVTEAALLRCLFGNPFHPQPRLDAAWLTPRVLSLANGIYERRAFDHLPELASLLEDAGCHDAELLGHLRGPGPHARGCHVLDLVLGKA
jgi:hypothetical protein